MAAATSEHTAYRQIERVIHDDIWSAHSSRACLQSPAPECRFVLIGRGGFSCQL